MKSLDRRSEGEPQDLTYKRVTYASEIGIPLLQAVVVGICVMTLAVLVTSAFNLGLKTGMGAGAFLATLTTCIMLILRFTFEIRRPMIWEIEKRVGIDLDRDQVIGYPQRPVIDEGKVDVIARLIIHNAYDGLPFTRRWFVDDNEMCTQPEWEAAISRLRNRGVLKQQAGMPDTVLPETEKEALERYLKAPRARRFVVSEDDNLVSLD